MAVRLDDVRDEVEIGPEQSAFARDAKAMFAWVFLIAGAAVGGRIINESFATNILAPPLFGRFDLRIGPATVLAAAVGGSIVWWGPRVAATFSWRVLVVATPVAAAVWAVSLALVDGADALTAPVMGPHDYLASAGRIEAPGVFLQSFTDQLDTFSLHVQGHPPGMVLILWSLAGLGLGAPGWAAALMVATGVSTSAALLLVVKSLAGESKARNRAPFLVLSPAAIWIATSADALFMGVGAWGIALLVLGAKRRSDYLALAGGVALGLLLFLSYGAVALGPVALVAAWVHGGLRPLLVALGGVLAVTLVFKTAGFWWFDGLSGTVARYEAGVSSQRPIAWFAVANLGALALVLGPAAAVGLARLRRAPVAALTWAALAGVLAADLSGLSKGEVERIWLIFVPWILVACTTIDLRRARGMLALQGLAALAIQTGVRTPW
jgi:methylthioxylose transferase